MEVEQRPKQGRQPLTSPRTPMVLLTPMAPAMVATQSVRAGPHPAHILRRQQDLMWQPRRARCQAYSRRSETMPGCQGWRCQGLLDRMPRGRWRWGRLSTCRIRSSLSHPREGEARWPRRHRQGTRMQGIRRRPAAHPFLWRPRHPNPNAHGRGLHTADEGSLTMSPRQRIVRWHR